MIRRPLSIGMVRLLCGLFCLAVHAGIAVALYRCVSGGAGQ